VVISATVVIILERSNNKMSLSDNPKPKECLIKRFVQRCEKNILVSGWTVFKEKSRIHEIFKLLCRTSNVV